MSFNKNTDWVEAIIIEDDLEEEIEEVFEIISIKKRVVSQNIQQDIKDTKDTKDTKEEQLSIFQKKTRNVKAKQPLKICFNEDITIIECGIDEAGRGPMFGRVYAGLVILPKDDTFDHSLMKDSKKFHSKKKIEQIAEYIKENSVAWAVEYEDEQTIDEINILQATQSAMHKCIKTILKKISHIDINNILLLVDGNYFKPYSVINTQKTKVDYIRYQMIEGGDNKYTSIAAASILAKVSRDNYIEELCSLNPELIEHYAIESNKGYGSKKHMDGIRQHGITKWHRKTFGICKEYC
jgi:ribonuclease HII